MALIMYLTKAPKYRNITTGEYETIPRKDIELIDDYFTWKMVRSEGGNAGDSLMEWCGTPESEMQHKYVVNYYRHFFTLKRFYLEYAGETSGCTIFDQLARIVKANQTFRWFIENVMNGKPDEKYHEVTKEQLADLLYVCRRVRKGFKLVYHDEDYGDTFEVDEELAQEFLPIMEEQWYFFGAKHYGPAYARTTIETLEAVKYILETTNFEKETIYFNATW